MRDSDNRWPDLFLIRMLGAIARKTLPYVKNSAI